MIQADFAAVWADFCGQAATLGPTPGVREAWHQGRAAYAVWVLAMDAPAVHARTDAVRDALGDAVVPVPPVDRHVTTWVAGFPAAAPQRPDDVAQAALDAAAAAPLPGPVRLEVGPANAFRSCAMLEVRDPHGDLARLRAALAVHHPEQRWAPYRPHLTVGRFWDARPTAPIRAALAPHRALPPLPVVARTLHLVAVDPQVADAPLRVLCARPLPAG